MQMSSALPQKSMTPEVVRGGDLAHDSKDVVASRGEFWKNRRDEQRARAGAGDFGKSRSGL